MGKLNLFNFTFLEPILSGDCFYLNSRTDVKQLLFLIMTLLPCLSLAEIPKCSLQKVNVIGKYGDKGQDSSPLLDMWSEVSGNLTAVEIRSKEAFTKIILVLKDADKKELSKKEIRVQKNKAENLDLAVEIKKQQEKAKSFELRLYAGETVSEFCHEEVIIVEKDGEGGREVKNEK